MSANITTVFQPTVTITVSDQELASLLAQNLVLTVNGGPPIVRPVLPPDLQAELVRQIALAIGNGGQAGLSYDATTGFYSVVGSSNPGYIPSINAVTEQFPDDVRTRLAANLTDASQPEGAILSDTVTGFLRWKGTTPGTVPVPKPAGDTRAGVWEMTNNSEAGYLFHLLLGANANHNNTALIALGVDNDGVGLLIPNKQKGRGIVGDQRATVTAADAYWLHATQRSPGSPLVRLEMQANDAAPLMQMLAFGTPGADQKLLYIGDPTGQAGVINAADGSIEWRRNITVQDPASGSGTSVIAVTSNNGVVAGSRQHTRHVKDGLEYYNPTGAAGTWWPFKIAAGGSHLQIRAGGSTSAVGTLPTMVNMIDVQNGKLSFFGATAVAQPTGMGAAATDAATTQALVNNLRTAMINLGLVTA